MKAIVNVIAAICSTLIPIFLAPGHAQADPAIKIVSDSPDQPSATRHFVLHSDRLAHDVLVVSASPSSVVLTAAQKLPTIYALDSANGIADPIARPTLRWAQANR